MTSNAVWRLCHFVVALSAPWLTIAIYWNTAGPSSMEEDARLSATITFGAGVVALGLACNAAVLRRRGASGGATWTFVVAWLMVAGLSFVLARMLTDPAVCAEAQLCLPGLVFFMPGLPVAMFLTLALIVSGGLHGVLGRSAPPVDGIDDADAPSVGEG
ncbi:hypothetical protein WKY82_01305 [Gordonia malaquae]|uniref:hypothetical protein n=1 Tax=Gordonia TaxID=2053 RepID=UPI00301A6788